MITENDIAILKPVRGSGLSIKILPGRARFGSRVYEITEAQFPLPANSTIHFFINQDDGMLTMIMDEGDFPRNCIPICIAKTDGLRITNLQDKRAFMVG